MVLFIGIKKVIVRLLFNYWNVLNFFLFDCVVFFLYKYNLKLNFLLFKVVNIRIDELW